MAIVLSHSLCFGCTNNLKSTQLQLLFFLVIACDRNTSKLTIIRKEERGITKQNSS